MEHDKRWFPFVPFWRALPTALWVAHPSIDWLKHFAFGERPSSCGIKLATSEGHLCALHVCDKANFEALAAERNCESYLKENFRKRKQPWLHVLSPLQQVSSILTKVLGTFRCWCLSCWFNYEGSHAHHHIGTKTLDLFYECCMLSSFAWWVGYLIKCLRNWT